MSSPDLGEFLKLSKPRRCSVAEAAAALSPAEQSQLEAACDQDPGIITTGAISQWLAARGHRASSPAVTAHRRKNCACHAH